MNLPTTPAEVFSSFFRSGFFITRVALAGALVTGAPAFSSTVQFFDDPETMQMHYLPDGRVSFAKAGAYLGPMKGERCNQTAMKDMKHDRVEPVCKPHFGGRQTYPGHVRVAYPGAAINEASGVLLSAGLIGEVKAQAPTSYTLPLVTELVALNFKQAAVSPPRGTPIGGRPESPVQTPPAIPLPATAWLMLAGLAMLWRFRNG